MVQALIPFDAQFIQKAIGVVTGVAQLMMSDKNEQIAKQEEILNRYNEQRKTIAKKYAPTQKEKEPQKVDLTSELYEFQKKLNEQKAGIDLTSEKIKGGTSCIVCSRDHLTQAAGLLEEAYKFVNRPDYGINSDEVKNRVKLALKEMNNMERYDLLPENVEKLQGEEKRLAQMALNASATIRHDLTEAITNQNTEAFKKAVAEASDLSGKYFNQVWDYSVSSGKAKSNISKVCGEDQVCRERLETIIEEK